MDALLSSYELGPTPLANRVVMAPMTRSRAMDGQADENTAIYYAQRAGAGLIVSEGMPISEQGVGYLYNPGIHREAQVAGWRRVTEAVHEQGGRIFAQLWHVGRVSHHSLQPEGRAPVSSVAVAGGQAFAYHPDGTPGNIAASQPEALDEAGIQAVIEDYRRAAANAMAAGFDGVEVHAANGYLIEQFINPVLNVREDRYGGATLESRSRFLLEVVDAVSEEIGAERVGVRLSPYSELHDMPRHADTPETYLYIADALDRRQIAYVHLVVEGAVIASGLLSRFRKRWRGTLISAGGLTAEQADCLIEDGLTDLAAFGTPFVANPDFVERTRHGWPLAMVDRRAFYGGGAEGYIDYPTYRESLAAAAVHALDAQRQGGEVDVDADVAMAGLPSVG